MFLWYSCTHISYSGSLPVSDSWKISTSFHTLIWQVFLPYFIWKKQQKHKTNQCLFNSLLSVGLPCRKKCVINPFWTSFFCKRNTIFLFNDHHHVIVLHLIIQLSQNNKKNFSIGLLTEGSLSTSVIFYRQGYMLGKWLVLDKLRYVFILKDIV